MVTAATYKKAHFFRRRDLLDALQHELLRTTQEFGWIAEAWSVFSNHYGESSLHSKTQARITVSRLEQFSDREFET